MRMLDAVVTAFPFVVRSQRFPDAVQRLHLAPRAARASACRQARASGRRCTPVSSAPASRCSGRASLIPGPATPRTSRQNLRPGGSARTSCRDAARNSCCRASACNSRGTACTTARTTAVVADAGVACRRCRLRARPRGAGSSYTTPRCPLPPPASARVQASPDADARDRTESLRLARRRARTIRPTARSGAERRAHARRFPVAVRRGATRGCSLRSSRRAARSGDRAVSRQARRPIRQRVSCLAPWRQGQHRRSS